MVDYLRHKLCNILEILFSTYIARTTFDNDAVNARMLNDNYLKKMKDTKAIIRFLMAHQKRDPSQAWNITEIVDGEVQSSMLIGSDFKKMEISLINMAQHRECYESETHPISEDCWRMPVFTNNGQYDYEYDDSYNEVVKYCKPTKMYYNLKFISTF